MALQGSGTELDPYLIGTPEELDQVRNDLSAHYRQVADIDMSDFVGFQPIGNNTTPFTGSYDGGGYKIINLSMSITSANNYVGIFGYVKGTSSTSKSTLKNMHIINPDFRATGSVGYMGILCGFIYTFVNLENIYIEGGTIYTYLSNGIEFGAVAGRCWGDTTTKNTIRNIIVKDFVYDINNSKVGGLFGTLNYANIENALSFPLSFRNTNNRTFLYSTSNSTFSKCYTISVSGSNGSGTTSVTTLPTGKSSSEYASLTFGIYEPINIVEGNYPYITFAGVSSERAIMISTESDLDYIRNNPSRYFKLANDIPIAPRHNMSYVLDINFTGDLNGDGFSFTDIDIYNTSDNIDYSFFNSISGKIYNVGFKYKRMTNINKGAGVYMNPQSSLICWSLYGTIKNVAVTVETESISTRNHGLVGWFYDGAVLEDTYFETPILRAGGNTNTYGESYIRVWGGNTSGNISIKRNIARIDSWYAPSGSRYYPEAFGEGYNTTLSSADLSDNVIYTATSSRMWFHSGISSTTSESTFQNPTWYAYNNFDKEKIWLFEQGNNPKLRTFYKIVAKIEERLVESYSRIIKGFNNRFVGRFEKLISFSKTIKSKLNSKKIKFSNVSSFIKPLYTKTISEKLKLNNVKSFSKPIKSRVSKLKFGLRDTISHSKLYISNLISRRKSNKTVNSFANKIYAVSIANMISKILRSVKSFSRNIKSNILHIKLANIIRKGFSKEFKSNTIRYRVTSTLVKAVSKSFTSKIFKRVRKGFKVNSFSRRFFGKSISELARKMIRQVMSFSRAMRSRIWKFSNKFQFVIVTVKGGMKAIIGNVDRFATIKRFVKSHTKKLTSWVSMFYIVASPQEVYAFIKATFRKVKLFKRENETIMNIKKHKTKISKSNK